MTLLPRGLAALMLLTDCAAPGERTAVDSLSPEASLDARSLGRAAAAARPASVQVQDDPGNPAVLFTVSPRLQTGSPNSLPMIVTSFGAERQRSDGATAYRALVSISNARRAAGFAHAATRQGMDIPVQVLSRDTQCVGAGCLFVEALMLTFPTDMVRQAAGAGAPLRVRLTGSAAYVEAGIPAGHVRALWEATVAPATR